ncbi:MAG: ComF family protein [Oscillospiraceae bacterium]|nr:ComF family protein [Oscillospiraceae bacterium]
METFPVTGLLHRGKHFEHCCSVYYYEKHVASAVKRLKFGGMDFYARSFGRILAQRLKEENQQFDLITWVPVSPQRKYNRGYDQAQLIACAVGEALGIPVISALKKIRHTPPQAGGLDASQRRANVLNAYVAVNPSQITGKRILVVDDVITSGATLSECCRILKMAGAKSLLCGTFAAGK